MKAILSRLWTEEDGALLSAELILIATILVIAMIVGLAALRDSIVTELGDVAQALANLDQSFSFSGIEGHHAFTAGGAFHDTFDFCDIPTNDRGQQSKCIVICNVNFPPERCEMFRGKGAGRRRGG